MYNYLSVICILLSFLDGAKTKSLNNEDMSAITLMKKSSLLGHLVKKQITSDSTIRSDGDQLLGKSCCSPSSWQSLIFQRNPGAPDQLFIRYVDDKLQRSAFDSFNKMRYLYVFYKNGTAAYYTINLEMMSCLKYTVHVQFDQMNIQCIPSSAVNRGTLTIGAGWEVLQTEDWIWNAMQGELLYERVATSKNCFPVVDTAYTKNGTYLGSLSYLNMTYPVRDKAVFKVPTYCPRTDDQMLPPFDPQSIFWFTKFATVTPL